MRQSCGPQLRRLPQVRLDSRRLRRYTGRMNEAVAILSRERESAVAKVDALVGELRELRSRVKSIDDAISVLTGHRPEPKAVRLGVGELKTAITDALRKFDDTGATVREITEAVAATRPGTTDASVSSTLSRLKNEDGTCENRQGKWYLKVAEPNSKVVPLEIAEDEDSNV